MMNWQTGWQELSKLTGWDLVKQPLDGYINWYWDSTAWTFLNFWYLPHRMPQLHSDADKWVSQFTLNGIRASVRP
jgi:hypothetical protein